MTRFLSNGCGGKDVFSIQEVFLKKGCMTSIPFLLSSYQITRQGTYIIKDCGRMQWKDPGPSGPDGAALTARLPVPYYEEITFHHV